MNKLSPSSTTKNGRNIFEVTMRLDKTNTNSYLDFAAANAALKNSGLKVTETINESDHDDLSEVKSIYLEKEYIELSPSQRNNNVLNQ